MICGKCRRQEEYLVDLSNPKQGVKTYFCAHCGTLEVIKPLKIRQASALPGGIVRLRLELKKRDYNIPPF